MPHFINKAKREKIFIVSTIIHEQKYLYSKSSKAHTRTATATHHDECSTERQQNVCVLGNLSICPDKKKYYRYYRHVYLGEEVDKNK